MSEQLPATANSPASKIIWIVVGVMVAVIGLFGLLACAGVLFYFLLEAQPAPKAPPPLAPIEMPAEAPAPAPPVEK